MNEHEYNAALNAARSEREAKLAEKRQLEGRIAWLDATIASLERIVEPEKTGETSPDALEVLKNISGLASVHGLTNACREVLRAATEPVQPADVVRLLELSGFDVNRYAHALSAVHTVLGRMVERGETRIVKRKGLSRPLYVAAAGPSHHGHKSRAPFDAEAGK